MAVEADWYYRAGGRKRVGPVSQEALCLLFQARELGPETKVWGKAFGRWVKADSIAGLRSVCGWAEPVAGEGGVGLVRQGEDGEEGKSGIGGLLLLPAVGRAVAPLKSGAVAVAYWMNAPMMEARGARPTEVLYTMAAVVGVVTLYELLTTVLFFAKKRAAVPLVVGGYACGLFLLFAVKWVAPEGMVRVVARVVGRVDENGFAGVVSGALVMYLLGIWYFAASSRVRATFVR